MSDLDVRPPEYTMRCRDGAGPEELLLQPRKVWLGKTTEVSRVLPNRDIRMIGAWCFLDHYGPEDVSASPGMRVWAHPHTGLQTVTWLLEGELEHRDSAGSRVMVRPGQLNVMTAGFGIVHTELSLADRPPLLHGVQLWVALPAATRDTVPRLDSYTDLPPLRYAAAHGQVLVGDVDGVSSPARGHTPLCAADLSLDPGAEVTLAIDPSFEHGVLVTEGQVQVESSAASVHELLYLGTGRRSVRIRSAVGARVMLLGGEPFAEETVMWWNFLGRTHEEVVGYREAWLRRDSRFPPVVDRSERVMEAPAMPTVPLRPRPHRREAR